MKPHVIEWLDAYYDGELRGQRKQQVEAHLAECAECRDELEALSRLSIILQEAPQARLLLSAQNFNANVKLRLHNNPPIPGWQKALRAGWLSAPAVAIAGWAFLQAALLLAGLAPLLGLNGALGLSSQSAAGWLVWTAPAVLLGLVSVASTALLVAFLAGWLTSMWAYRRHLDFQSGNNLLARIPQE